MSSTPLKYLEFLIFVKLLIQRYQFIGITLSKPYLVCTFYNNQINAKKYEWKFESVQILLVGDCSILAVFREICSTAYLSNSLFIKHNCPHSKILVPYIM